jgi:hypothetical protein
VTAPPETAAGLPRSDLATIVLRRERGSYRDFMRSYQVIVDGEMAAKIKRGQTLTLPIPAGRHEIFIRIDWCRSPVLEVDAGSGQVIEMSCEPAGSSTEGLGAVIGQATESYIRLSRL